LKAEKEAEKASKILDEKLGTLAKAESSGTDETKVKEARNEVFKAEAEAEKASRKAAKADVKAQQAAQEAEALGVKFPDKKEEDPANETHEDSS
jgi:hypothetical protein